MKYSKGFKRAIVRRVAEYGMKIVYQEAKETEISSTTISSWIEMHKASKLTLESINDLTPSYKSSEKSSY